MRTKTGVKCPWCAHRFANGTQGWQGHITSGKHNDQFEPGVTDAEKLVIFEQRNPNFFAQAKTPSKRRPPSVRQDALRKVEIECPECGGAGFVSADYNGKPVRAQCPECKGAGKVTARY